MKNPCLHIFNIMMSIFMLVPILVIILVSFSPTQAYVIPTTHWSLRWYENISQYPEFLYGFFLSLSLSFLAAVIATVLGFLASYAMIRYDFKGKIFFDALFFSPITMPAVIVGFALLIYFSKIGLYDSFEGFLVTYILLAVPYVIRTINTSLEGIGKDVELAAMSLGASRTVTFLKITMPLVKVGILGGFLYAFLICFGEVTVAIFLSSTMMRTLPLLMFNMMQDASSPVIAAVSSLLIVFAAVFMVFINKFASNENFSS